MHGGSPGLFGHLPGTTASRTYSFFLEKPHLTPCISLIFRGDISGSVPDFHETPGYVTVAPPTNEVTGRATWFPTGVAGRDASAKPTRMYSRRSAGGHVAYQTCTLMSRSFQTERLPQRISGTPCAKVNSSGTPLPRLRRFGSASAPWRREPRSCFHLGIEIRRIQIQK